jgi:hypothetical protein
MKISEFFNLYINKRVKIIFNWGIIFINKKNNKKNNERNIIEI